ncbi:NADPH2:quinone reductase [Thermomonospora echinospora]|uniref:NADPH2:quinone reductase n=1 Tax=Thermomonospora echinospora TaxID=1992 RepID=A0A1H6BGJ0_9ACTN|nr:zinc-binding dehydrogenase [Thermomonospora echinospora]SEG59336.1 NADPH2:quinone reductase [Thermomonospora echinospora]
MKIVEAKEFGGPEVLTVSEVPDPVAGSGQVVVGVAAADTLFVDTQIRAGWAGEHFGITPPYVPGGAVAGRVLRVGEGADPGWTGRRVVAYTGDLGGHGGYAEQVAVAAGALVPVPDGLDLRDAAALVHDGVTGVGVFEAAAVRPGEHVLIVGATGGMGVLFVQLAHAAGAHVIAAARSARKLALARELGADVVVDYSEDGWTEQVRQATGGRGPDLVLDGVGGEMGRAAFQVTARGGRFSAHGAPSGDFAGIDLEEARRREVTVRGIGDVQYGMADRRRLAETAMAKAAAGRLRPVIGQTFPLERAAEAHAAIESRQVIGKTLLLT